MCTPTQIPMYNILVSLLLITFYIPHTHIYIYSISFILRSLLFLFLFSISNIDQQHWRRL